MSARPYSAIEQHPLCAIARRDLMLGEGTGVPISRSRTTCHRHRPYLVRLCAGTAGDTPAHPESRRPVRKVLDAEGRIADCDPVPGAVQRRTKCGLAADTVTTNYRGYVNDQHQARNLERR